MEEYSYRLFKRRLGSTGKVISPLTDIDRIKELIPKLDSDDEYYVERYSFIDDDFGLELTGFDIMEIDDFMKENE